MLDAFDDEGIPQGINNINFFNACFKLLSTNGILVLNYWSSLYKNRKEEIEFLKLLFAGKILSIEVENCSNWVFFMFKNQKLRELRFAQKSEIMQLKKNYLTPYDKLLHDLLLQNNLRTKLFE